MILNEILMKDILENAKIKPSGYVEEIIKAATHVEYDKVFLTNEAYLEIKKKYWKTGQIPSDYIIERDINVGRCCS